MAAAASRIDELVKEYLLQRGLTSALRALDVELKNEKEKGLRVDRIVDQLQQHISSFDLVSLREYWSHLSNKLFSRLDQRYMPSVWKMEVGLLKFYLVFAAQNNRHDKVTEFFEKLTSDLQNQTEFQEWFTFPFVKNPEDNTHFSVYFTRHWQETYFLSLHNFLGAVLQIMPLPSLLAFEEDMQQKRKLLEENEALKMKLQIQNLTTEAEGKSLGEWRKTWSPNVRTTELVFDFSGLSEEKLAPEKNQKPGKRFTLNFPSSPLLGKKPGGSVALKKNEQPSAAARVNLKTPSKLKSVDSVSMPDVKDSKSHNVLVRRMSVGATAMMVSMSPGETGTMSRLRQQQEYEKQRRQLLGQSETVKNKDKRVTAADTQLCSLSLPNENEVQLESALNFRYAENSDEISRRKYSQSGESVREDVEKRQDFLEAAPFCPFLLLSQEEYAEHRSAICYCRFSNSGQYVASLDADGVVKVWTWSPQPATKATCMAKSPFLSLEWSQKSDRLLLLGNRSGNIRLFDVKEKKSIVEACADQSYPRIRCLCCSPANNQFVCSATASKCKIPGTSNGGIQGTGRIGRLSVWDIKSMKMEKTLPIDTGPVAVNCCAFNHNGQLLIVGAVDGAVRLFDMQQQKCLSKWQAHDGEILSIQFSADETSCYSMGTDGKFITWSVHKSGRKLHELPIFHSATSPIIITGPLGSKEVLHGRAFAFDSEGQYVLTCAKNDGVIYQVTKNSIGDKLMDLRGHKGLVTTVDWSPSIDTKVCLTGSLDSKVKISTFIPS